MKSYFGKGVVLIISTILYTIFRIMEFISKPMLFLDLFMLIIFLFSFLNVCFTAYKKYLQMRIDII